jgi:hypothetical protein
MFLNSAGCTATAVRRRKQSEEPCCLCILAPASPMLVLLQAQDAAQQSEMYLLA